MFNIEATKILLLFKIKFAQQLRLRSRGSGECLILMIMGLFAKLETINALRKQLGIPKDKIYRNLKELTVQDWKNLFKLCFEQLAIDELLKIAKDRSRATWSNKKIQLSIDDSVIRKYSCDSLSYVGKWFSGQLKRAVKGYDVLLAVLIIGDLVIPVAIHLYSKKDSKSKVERMGKILEALARRWKKAGIPLSRIPVTADNGYASNDFVKVLQGFGFKKAAVGASKAWVVSDEENPNEEATYKVGSFLNLENLSQADKTAWGINVPVIAKKVYYKDYGKVLMMGRKATGKMRLVMGIGIDRKAELYRIWAGHFKIEQLFRFLKSGIKWGKYSLRGKTGAMATIMTAFLGYAILIELKKKLKRKQITYYMLTEAFLNRWFTDIKGLFEGCQLEHFNIKPPSSDQLLGL